ncbi:MAG: hypothetical protein RR033_03145 [Clostridia bacterium]
MIDNVFKVVNDGSHFLAHFATIKGTDEWRGGGRGPVDSLFDEFYLAAMRADIRNVEKQVQYILKRFMDIDEYRSEDCIRKSIEQKRLNLASRKRRFNRKANLNSWNYFVTLTYDDEKMNESTYKKRLKKCLSNLHTRRGWKYMGVFERAPETGRLHFHALIYVPDGQMVGSVVEVKDYNPKKGKTESRNENDFFQSTFGRNDFAVIEDFEVHHGKAIDYILKYISKSDEKIFYSRGIPCYFEIPAESYDIAAEVFYFGMKYILFDDILDDGKRRVVMRC